MTNGERQGSSLRPPEPQDIIVFGATGDLARRKLFPALYELQRERLLPEQGLIIGLARGDNDDDDLRRLAREAVRSAGRQIAEADDAWREFAARLRYVRLDGEGHRRLTALSRNSKRLIYLATPPDSFGDIVAALRDTGLNRDARILIEKPFGRDLASARQLNQLLHEALDESQIFRVDHYLAKETVQNILVLRFANAFFERLWDRDSIDHIEITVAETLGVEDRAGFYEGAGALRDVVQNHLLQVLAMLTMEPPVALSAEAIHQEKTKLLHAVRPLQPSDVIRAQYTAGQIDGHAVPGYREEPGVEPASETETFAALRLRIDNWRWQGVPVYLRTGKRLARACTEVEVAFRGVPLRFFAPTAAGAPQPNHLILQVQPEERVDLSFVVKAPGAEVRARSVHMTFDYEDVFTAGLPGAYERLLHDAMCGDRTLFVSQAGVEQAWALLQAVLENPPQLCFYPAGSWGPEAAAGLIAPDRWHLR